LRYRVHDGQLSHAMDHMQAEGTAIRNRFLRQWIPGDPPADADLALHDAIARDQFCAEYQWLEQAASWLEKLALHNDNRPRFAREAFLRALTGRYVALARFADGHEIDRPRADASWFVPYLHKDALPMPTR